MHVPAHLSWVILNPEAVGPPALLNGIEKEAEHPKLSVINTDCTPAHKLVAVAVVAPVFQEYTKGAVPPTTVKPIWPLHKLQVAFVTALAVMENGAGKAEIVAI